MAVVAGLLLVVTTGLLFATGTLLAVVAVAVGIGLSAADGFAVAPTGVLIAALVTMALEDAAAVPAGCVAETVPPLTTLELVATFPPVKAFPEEPEGPPDENEVRLLVLPGVRVGKFRL